MNILFDIDGPVMRRVIKFTDCMILSVLWIIFSLPVITAGAASAALYTTIYEYIRKDKGTLWRTFWNAFRENFKRSTAVWCITLLIQLFIIADVMIFRSMKINGELLGSLYPLMLVVFLISVTWSVYTSAYAARFNGSARDVLRLGFLLMAIHPLRSLGVLISVLCGAALVITVPGFIAVMPAAVYLLCSVFLEKVFLLHMRREDIEKMRINNEL